MIAASFCITARRVMRRPATLFAIANQTAVITLTDVTLNDNVATLTGKLITHR
jgi:hypothetical protein